MTEKKYKAKCKQLFIKAKEKGVELHFDFKRFPPERLNCLWYGGYIAKIECPDGISVELYATGDVKATLYDKNGEELVRSKDKRNIGSFANNMRLYLKTDKQLKDAIEEGRLILESNNWIEGVGRVKDEDGIEHIVDLEPILDNCLDDDILEAIKQILEDIEAFSEGVVEVWKAETCQD